MVFFFHFANEKYEKEQNLCLNEFFGLQFVIGVILLTKQINPNIISHKN